MKMSGGLMNVDVEMIVKLVLGICSMFGLWKIWAEISRGKKSDLREDYNFSYQFFKEYESDKNMQPILIEKGLKAVAGTSTLSANEIFYLLSLKYPYRNIRVFDQCQDYLVFNEAERTISFSKCYRFGLYRKVMKVASLILYMVSFSAVIFPVLLMKSLPSFGNIFTMLFGAAFLLYLAWSSVNKYAMIRLSERFMDELQSMKKG
jgi:hypothetical protein